MSLVNSHWMKIGSHFCSMKLFLSGVPFTRHHINSQRRHSSCAIFEDNSHVLCQRLLNQYQAFFSMFLKMFFLQGLSVAANERCAFVFHIYTLVILEHTCVLLNKAKMCSFKNIESMNIVFLSNIGLSALSPRKFRLCRRTFFPKDTQNKVQT